MSTAEKPKAVEQKEADHDEICRLVAAGQKVTDPELIRRVRERSEAVQKEIRDRFGVVEWAVEMVREARDE
jgi:hypothetical protein